jgi:hypothetical protein
VKPSYRRRLLTMNVGTTKLIYAALLRGVKHEPKGEHLFKNAMAAFTQAEKEGKDLRQYLQGEDDAPHT